MTRQPFRHRHHSSKSWPFAFSSFARTANLAASTSRFSTKQKQLSSSKLDTKVLSTSRGNGTGKTHSKRECSEFSRGEDNDGIGQLDFDFLSPKPEDFHGVKVLLQTYLDDTQWYLSGSVVKIEDEEDENDDCLYSVVTALNLD